MSGDNEEANPLASRANLCDYPVTLIGVAQERGYVDYRNTNQVGGRRNMGLEGHDFELLNRQVVAGRAQ
jgi:hypothetical protein